MATILKNNIKPSGNTLKGLIVTDDSGTQHEVKFVRQVNNSGGINTLYDTFDHYEYSDITVTANHTYNGDVGANGSAVAVASAPTYKQTRWSVGASGAKYNETLITTGATITYSGTHVASNGTVSGSSLGTTVAARNTSFASSVATISLNGKSVNTSGVAVAQAANAVTNSNYQPSGYVATCSIGSGITAGGGSATVTASAYHVAYNYYTSGSKDTNTHQVNDTASLSIVTNSNSRFSLSGTTLSHTKMGTNVTTDNVTVRCTNASNTSTYKDASTSVTNTQTAVNDGIKSYGTPTISIGSGLTAAGGSATITRSVTNVRYWHYTYTDTSANEAANARTKDEAGTVNLSIVSNGNSRFSLSGTTLTHSNMTTNSTTDSVTVRAANAGSTSLTKDASTSITNTATKNIGNMKSYGTPSVSIGSGITAAGGSATVSHSVTNVRYWYYTYTSGSKESTTAHEENVAGTTTISITSNGNSRFSLSGNTLSHSSMGTSATTDSVTITAKNSSDTSKTKTASTSVTNSAGTQHYKNTSGTTGDNWTYGTPSTPSVSNSLKANGGSATFSSSVTNTKTYYLRYTSGSYSGLQTENPAGSVGYSLTTNGNSRFSISGAVVSHSNMTTNVTTDTCGVKAYNASDSSKISAEKTASVTNSYSDAWNNPSVSAFSYNSTSFTYSGGTATVSSKTASQSGTRTFTSGSTSALSNSTFTWSFSGSATGFSVNTSTGAVTIANNNGAARSITVTATATANGKSGTKTAVISQALSPYNGYDYKDLGFPSGIKWAKCNVGASAEYQVGNYYAFGKSTPYKSGDTGYNTNSGFDSKLPLAYDTARNVMGGNWRMPTISEMQELFGGGVNSGFNAWFETINNVKGVHAYRYYNSSAGYVFIPVSGYFDRNTKYDSNTVMFWLSNRYYSTSANSVIVTYDDRSNLDENGNGWRKGISLSYGIPVRGVIE